MAGYECIFREWQSDQARQKIRKEKEVKQESEVGIRSQDASKLSVPVGRGGAMEGVGAKRGYNQSCVEEEELALKVNSEVAELVKRLVQ